MIEILFIIGFAAFIYHLYNIINQDFDTTRALIIFIIEIVLLALFISLTAATLDVKTAIMLKFIVIFAIIETLLLLIEFLVKLQYVEIKK